jgi:hypothetical protein
MLLVLSSTRQWWCNNSSVHSYAEAVNECDGCQHRPLPLCSMSLYVPLSTRYPP